MMKYPMLVTAALSASFTFADIPAVEETFLTPGLLQGRVAGDANFTDSILTSDIPLRRELGPGMGLITDKGGYLSGNPTYYQSPIDAVKTAWAENVTFIYKGMIYLDASKLYVFGARIDDSSFLKIGEAVLISSSTGGGCHLETYAPAYTGWYPVEIRCGNGNGWAGANPYCTVGKLGFCYLTVEAGSDEAAQYQSHRKDSCDDITATWTQLIDDGSGNLFGTSPQTGLLDAVQVTYAGRTEDSVALSILTEIKEAVNVYAWYGPEYGGTDKDAWANELWLGRTEGTGADVVTAQFGIPEGTKYVRIVAISATDGTHKWAGKTLEVESLDPIAHQPEATVSLDEETSTCFDVDVIVNVTYPGYGTKNWTATLTYADRSVEVTGSGAGRQVFELRNLIGGSSFTGKVVIAADNGYETVIDNVAIRTKGEPSLGLVPGLTQGRLNGSRNLEDAITESTIPLRRELGPVMGLYTDTSGGNMPYTSELDGVKSYWADNVTYVYVGQIWLDAAKTYAFAARNDDSCDMKIDGTVVLAAANGGCRRATYTPDYTGWHAIEIRSGNGAGWAGANPYCPVGKKGIVYNDLGKTDHECQNTAPDEDWWIPLKDTGDMRLLATPGEGMLSDSIAIGDVLRRTASVRLTVDLKMDDPVKVYAWTGPTYGGADASAWVRQTSELAAKAQRGAADGVTVRVPVDGADNFVRLFAVSERDNSIVWTSPTVPLAAYRAEVGFTVIIR